MPRALLTCFVGLRLLSQITRPAGPESEVDKLRAPHGGKPNTFLNERHTPSSHSKRPPGALKEDPTGLPTTGRHTRLSHSILPAGQRWPGSRANDFSSFVRLTRNCLSGKSITPSPSKTC